jgi:hypothetical protein
LLAHVLALSAASNAVSNPVEAVVPRRARLAHVGHGWEAELLKCSFSWRKRACLVVDNGDWDRILLIKGHDAEGDGSAPIFATNLR